MNTRKLVWVLLCSLMFVMLSGCGSKKDEAITTSTFIIYDVDVNDYKTTVSSTVEIPDQLSLEEKIQALCNTLSKVKFTLPIELVSIDEVGKRKIATINLRDGEEGKVWGSYFAGSTGAAVNVKVLSSSLLQKEYEGEWIDGVCFLQNNEIIDEDHCNPSVITYR
ncbi:MAG: hypothetical protein ACRCW2_08525 [Cellulosilyticaceae bacterium]